MKTKLMIIALTFCSSLAVAGEAAAPVPVAKKKLMKAPRAPDKEQQIDETVLGNNVGSLGTSGLSTAPSTSAPAKKSVRGTAPSPTR